MFSKKKQPPIKSLIAEGCRITGNIAFSDGLRIDGEVHGDIRADDADNSLLVISETATINGTVTAQHIIINGQVTGPVHAHRILELEPQARIDGDVEYLALEMHQGALIRGQLHPLLESGQKPALLLATDNTNSPKSAKSANNINNTHNTNTTNNPP